MWQLVPPTARIGITVGAALLLGFVWTYFRHGLDGFTPSRFALGVLASVGTLYLIGSTLGRFRFTWEIPFHKYLLEPFFPNLNGVWLGEIRSAFGPEHSLHKGQMAMRITQTWFHILVATEREGGASFGKSTHVIPDKIDNTAWIRTFYRGYAHPQPGGTPIWFGASEFRFEYHSKTINGYYCSNRGYTVGTPTAGDFTLVRVSPDPNASVPWERPAATSDAMP